MLIAHGPLATISSYFILRKSIEKRGLIFKTLFLILTFIAGILPDFGLFYLSMRGLPTFWNRMIATHTPFLWICVYLLGLISVYLIKDVKLGRYKIKKEDIKLLLNVFLISVLSHLFFDLFSGHIMLLWPFSHFAFTFLGDVVPNNLFVGYQGNPFFALEITLCILFIPFALKVFRIKIAKIIYWILGFSVAYLCFNIFISTQTYNTRIPVDTDNHPIYDRDEDRLMDLYDMDVDNNGINNYDQAPKDLIANNAEKIINTGLPIISGISTKPQDIVLRAYGGTTFRRLILLSYIDAGYPLSPVIYEHMRNENITNFNEGLESYLILIANNAKELTPGVIFKTKDGTFGLVLNSKKVMIERGQEVPEIRDLIASGQ